MDKQLRNLIIITIIMLLITPTRQVEIKNGEEVQGDLKSIAQKTVEKIRE